jgi:FkbM family methyltransferase
MERPRDINLCVGVGAKHGTFEFHQVEDAGLSSFAKSTILLAADHGYHVTIYEVPVRTLADICAEHAAGREIDFLKIDVEGWERDALLGMDFQRFRPTILVIEATVPMASEPSHHHWESIVLEAGYLFTLFDGLNRFYLKIECRELASVLSIPANVFDEWVPPRVVSLESRLKRVSDHIAKVEHDLQSREDRIGELERQLNARNNYASALQISLSNLHTRARELQRERDQVRFSLARLLASTSWRFTAPARKILSWFRPQDRILIQRAAKLCYWLITAPYAAACEGRKRPKSETSKLPTPPSNKHE